MQREEQPLRRLLVDLSEIDFNASFNTDDSPDPTVGYLDTATGAVHTVPLAALRAAEEGEEGEPLEDWDAETGELAVALLEDTQGPYQELEPWEPSEEYDLMESFPPAPL